jgi:hypothetical protein
MRGEGKWFLGSVCHDPHNPLKINNLLLEESHHTQTASTGLNTAHEYHLQKKLNDTINFFQALQSTWVINPMQNGQHTKFQSSLFTYNHSLMTTR